MVDTNWGFTAGFQDAQQAQIDRSQKQQLFDLSMDVDRTKLAGAQMDLKERESALENAKAIQKIQSGALQKLAFDPNMDPVDKATSEFQAMALADAEGGFPVQGAELLKQSVVIAKDHEEIVSKQSDQKMKEITSFTNLIGTIHDQQSLDTAKMIVQSTSKTPLPSQLAHMQWDPQSTPKLLEQMNAAATTQMQKLQAEKEKAGTTLDKVRARKEEVDIGLDKARTDAEEALAAQRRKNAGDSGQPSKEDLAAAYDLVRPLSRSGGKNATAADNSAAKAAALPIAERIMALRKAGLSRSAAAAKAFQEEKEKPSSRLNDLGKADAPMETATRQIDDLLELLDKAEQRGASVTGVPGGIRRVAEYAGNVTGLRPNDSLSSQVESRLSLLQTELPTILGTSKLLSKQRQAEVETIIRGRGQFDSIQSARQSLEDIKSVISGGKPASSTQDQSKTPKYVAGDRYTDSKGRTAIYLGGDPMKPESWQTTK